MNLLYILAEAIENYAGGSFVTRVTHRSHVLLLQVLLHFMVADAYFKKLFSGNCVAASFIKADHRVAGMHHYNSEAIFFG